jgi:hypothetical protein
MRLKCRHAGGVPVKIGGLQVDEIPEDAYDLVESSLRHQPLGSRLAVQGTLPGVLAFDRSKQLVRSPQERRCDLGVEAAT